MARAKKPELWLTSSVYVFLRSDGIRKVGVSVDPRTRSWACTQATGIRHRIECVWDTEYHTASRVESAVHRSLKPFKLKGVTAIELYDLPFATLEHEIEAKFGLTQSGYVKRLAKALSNATQEKSNADG